MAFCCSCLKEISKKRSQVQKIAIAGLAAVAAVLGGAAVPAVAMAQPLSAAHPVAAAAAGTAEARPVSAAALRSAGAARIAEASQIARAVQRAGLGGHADLAAAAADGGSSAGEPLDSCVFTVLCLAVDGAANLTGSASGSSVSAATATAPLVHAAQWNGSSWKGVGVTLPTGTKAADLNGVSCKGAKSCLVAGDYYTSTSDTAAPHALALIYNGTSLKPAPAVPLPKGTSDAMLSDVSCVTTSYCVAVGVADGTSAAFGADGELILIDSWNGSKWTLHTASEGNGSSESLPTEVSCATTAFCALAGEKITISGSASAPTIGFGLYVADWNGKTLSTMKSAAAAASSADLVAPLSVSCATTANCGVTGLEVDDTSDSSAGVDSFTEIWNGSSWQLATTPWPAGSTEEITLGISCYAAHTCEAVGADSTDPLTATDPSSDVAAVSYTGTSGTMQSLSVPAKGYSDLFTDLSCLPWGTCVAVGDTGKDTATTPGTMTGTWNGKAWALHPGL
jgi:hypothetical protein